MSNFVNPDWLELVIYFQTNKPDGEQKSFMVNFLDNSDHPQGFKASLRDFWDRDISRKTAESHRYVFGRYRCLHLVTIWLWKIFNISSSASKGSPLFSRRNRSLYLLYRPLKLSQKTRCTILMYLGQEDCPPSTFSLSVNGAANLLRPCPAAGQSKIFISNRTLNWKFTRKMENEFTSVLLFISITFTLTRATSQKKILSYGIILHKLGWSHGGREVSGLRRHSLTSVSPWGWGRVRLHVGYWSNFFRTHLRDWTKSH